MPFIDLSAITGRQSAVTASTDPATNPSSTPIVPVPQVSQVSTPAATNTSSLNSSDADDLASALAELTNVVNSQPTESVIQQETPAATPLVTEPTNYAPVPNLQPVAAQNINTNLDNQSNLSGLKEIKGPAFTSNDLTNIPEVTSTQTPVVVEPALNLSVPVVEPTTAVSNLDLSSVDLSEPTTEQVPSNLVELADPVPTVPEASPIIISQPEQFQELPELNPLVQQSLPAELPKQEPETAVQPPLPVVNNSAPAWVSESNLNELPELTNIVPEVIANVEPLTEVAPIIAPITEVAPQPEELKPLNTQIENLVEQELSIQEILQMAVSMKASDIHLSPKMKPVVRVDGGLKNLAGKELQAADMQNIAEFLVPGHDWNTVLDVDAAYYNQDVDTRFRVNIFKQMNGLAIVLRLIPTKIPEFDELKLPNKLKDLTLTSHGLILVTGPTGSGKSTTIASLINRINKFSSEHIVTLEDPIEYVYPAAKSLVDQRSIGEDTENWQQALRAVLRQDPNIVLVGEMRDLETIKAALTVAETGHLVFATLHTNGAAQTIDRIIDVFPEGEQQQIRTQLASVLIGVASQKLVPTKTGGRKAAVELMVMTSAVKNAIREAKIHQIDNIIQTSGDIGMQSMEKSLAELIRQGDIDMETGQYYSNKPDELIRLLGNNK